MHPKGPNSFVSTYNLFWNMGTLGVDAPPYEVGASMGNPGSATGSVYIPLEDHQTSYIPDIQTSNTKNLYVFQTEVVPV